VSAPLSQVSSVQPSRWDPSHVYLAWSLCRTVSLGGGLFRIGPRGGHQYRYAVRVGIDSCGIAKGGCFLYRDRADAERAFLKYAAEERLAGSFGGTAADPDSIDVELAR
jgi:hypothetical protein